MKAAVLPDSVDSAPGLANNGSQNSRMASQPKVLPNSMRKLLASDDVVSEHAVKDNKIAGMVKMVAVAKGSGGKKGGGEKSVAAGLVKMTVLDEGGEDKKDGGEKSAMTGLVKMTVLDEGREDKRDEGEKSVMTDEEFLDFLKTWGSEQRLGEEGGLPWETQGVFSELQKVSQVPCIVLVVACLVHSFFFSYMKCT